ncbi:hypothetical protein ACLIYP_14655 [Streptomyces nanhaiensis]|uniref:hypothetical protein n=1 Tax=Streptomyces nanhaiensis TaxID=679319 RepID=UPI00399D5342
MTSAPRPPLSGHRSRNGLIRLAAHLDPIALVGIVLGIVLSIALDVTGAASGVESLLVGLMVTVVSLVLDTAARAERRFQLRDLVQTTDWLADSMLSAAGATRRIVEEYPGSVIEAEARQRLHRLAEELGDLSRGRVERPAHDYEHLLAATHACLHRLDAVTNIVGEPVWWRDGVGSAYWQANLDALARGVRIRRVFIIDRRTDEVAQLMAEQRRHGVEVVEVFVRHQDQDPALHLNFAIWDDRQAWRAQTNSRGQIMGNLFLANAQDVHELRRLFRRLVPAGDR